MDSQDLERAENLRRVYEQNWLHARHVENERLWFTNIYAVVMAGSLILMSETGLIWSLASFLLILSFLGFCMCHALRIAHVQHSRMADIISSREWQLRDYSFFYPSREQSGGKLYKSGEVRSKFVSLNEIFYLFYMLGAFVSAVLLIQAIVSPFIVQILLEVFVLVVLLLFRYCVFKRYEDRLHIEMGEINHEA